MCTLTYVEFLDPQDQVREHVPTPLMIRVLDRVGRALLPKSNPDFEGLFLQVTKWQLEIDESRSLITRELGLDSRGQTIVVAPFGKNLGFWMDSDLTIDDFHRFSPRSITAEEFEGNWNRFEAANKK